MEINLEELFLDGIKSGAIEDIAELMPYVDINYVGENGEFPLLLAVRRGDLAIVELLVGNGADLDMRDRFGYSAILSAAWLGKTDIIDYLLGCGEDIEKTDARGNTPLMLATMNADIHSVRYLLSKGASINKVDANGWTSLMKAVWNGRPEFVSLLLNAGADRHLKNKAEKDAMLIAEQYDGNMRMGGLDSSKSRATINILNGFEEFVFITAMINAESDYTETDIFF